jgi:hypothetical protein
MQESSQQRPACEASHYNKGLKRFSICARLI